MSKKNTHIMPYRRKAKRLTNYKKRLKLLLSHKPRLVIRKSSKNILAQIVEYDKKGDKILISAHSSSLDKLGWKLSKGNIPSSYLVGLLLGKKAKEKGITELVLDIGLQESVKGSRIYAVFKGVLDSGINIPHSNDMLPSEDRVNGEHIVKYANELKKDEGAYNKIFSSCLKNGADPTLTKDNFEKIKNKILGVR